MASARPSLAPLPSKVDLVPVGSLQAYERNPRTHSKKQVRQIAASIQEFGFTNPLLVDGTSRIIAGHGRLLAAQLLGMEEVPVLRLEHLSEAQVRAYVIADNRLAEKAGWDSKLLALELGELADMNFDIRLTGFDTAEADGMLSPMLDDDEEPAIPEPADLPVSRPGDLWLLGPHRLLCADATKPESYAQLLGEDKAQLVFTDPPYNVPIDGHVTVAPRKKHDEFVMASGEMTREEFVGFLESVFTRLISHSVEGSIHFVCMDWRHMGEMLAASHGRYAELKNLCVWNKANAGMGSLYRSKHEMVFVFKNGTAPHVNNVELGKHGRNRTNVWNYAGVTSMHKGRSDRLAMHPTVKPVAMIADAIHDCSHRGGIVLDPFGGSGSTLVAAENTGRQAALMELDPRYVDVIVRRYLRLGKAEVRHALTSKSFQAVCDERTASRETADVD